MGEMSCGVAFLVRGYGLRLLLFFVVAVSSVHPLGAYAKQYEIKKGWNYNLKNSGGYAVCEELVRVMSRLSSSEEPVCGLPVVEGDQLKILDWVLVDEERSKELAKDLLPSGSPSKGESESNYLVSQFESGANDGSRVLMAEMNFKGQKLKVYKFEFQDCTQSNYAEIKVVEGRAFPVFRGEREDDFELRGALRRAVDLFYYNGSYYSYLVNSIGVVTVNEVAIRKNKAVSVQVCYLEG